MSTTKPFAHYDLCSSVSYDDIYNEIIWDPATRGACVEQSILVQPENDQVPIVRSTYAPKYQIIPPHCKSILKAAQIVLEQNQSHVVFNNVLAECYQAEKRRMAFHTDQALDLKDDTFICLYSIYNDESEPNLRKLVVRNKTTQVVEEIALLHKSIVVFSTNTNRHFLHKIVSPNERPTSSEWIGLTFRCSKTSIIELNGRLWTSDGNPLDIASDEQLKEFYANKKQENKQINFQWPNTPYVVNSPFPLSRLDS